jgi:glycosyltransferase involved in cell wall biosynthesis
VAPPRFTVVIPTRDRPRALAACLAALRRQEGCGEFEVVAVDDGSRAAGEVAAVVRADPKARVLRTAPAGSVAARNRGIREARSQLVLLLDDDCEPRPGWAAALAAALEKGAAAAAGRVVNGTTANVFAEATQVVLTYLTLRALRADGTTSFAPTYNLACRRELLLEMPFDERYVNAGADRDWCMRLARRGPAIEYLDEAVVDHRQALGLREFCRKHFDYGRGSARFHRRHGVALERPGFYAGLVRAGFDRGIAVGLALCLAQIATAAGYASTPR